MDMESGKITLEAVSFHDDIKYWIAFAQLFGIMPLYDVTGSIQDVHFKWKSFRVFYAFFGIFGSFLSVLFWFVKFARDGIVIDSTAQMAFYINTTLAGIYLINLARHWPRVLREWSLVDMNMQGYHQINNKKKFRWIIGVFLGICSVEHISFILNAAYKSQECDSYKEDRTRAFFEVSFHNYFSTVRYNIWFGILVKIINTLSTFTWIATDLLIILISVALTTRFSQIVHRLKKNKFVHEKFWKEIRQDYQKLCNLSRTVEKYTSSLVLISYAHNIYFLCIQLYNSLRERSGVMEVFYFFYSFTVLVLRVLAISLYGAWLNIEARKPLDILHNIPTEQYCIEVRRLTEQIFTSPIGLTGGGFFIVTKTFLLKMAGTIVTFELMLFEFAPINVNTSVSYDCIGH